MTLKDFNNAVDTQIDMCKSLLAKKGNEYAPEFIEQQDGQIAFNIDAMTDRLHSFKKAAVLMNTTPKAALFGMLTKHLVSVSDMCTDKEEYPPERWSEKITDSINYLLILSAMVKEELENAKNSSKTS